MWLPFQFNPIESGTDPLESMRLVGIQSECIRGTFSIRLNPCMYSKFTINELTNEICLSDAIRICIPNSFWTNSELIWRTFKPLQSFCPFEKNWNEFETNMKHFWIRLYYVKLKNFTNLFDFRFLNFCVQNT